MLFLLSNQKGDEPTRIRTVWVTKRDNVYKHGCDNQYKMTDFIDIHKLERYASNKLEAIETDETLSAHNKKIILDYLRDCELGKTVKKGQKKKIGSGRILQTASFLVLMGNNWFKTDLDKVTQKQMETFVMKLDKGEIKSKLGKPYSSESKANIKKFIRKFYKHILTNGKFCPEICDWIDTSRKQTIIEAIPEVKEGIMKIIELIPDIKRKALIYALFDSGFREGEIINCRMRDLEKDKNGIFYITCRHSKTKPRTVSLPYSTKLLERWIEKHPHKDDPMAQLWQISRVMLYKTVRLYSKKALGRPFTVHQIRHTSATFWAPKLDRVSFCKRFGWSYSSGSPDRYIDVAKVADGQANKEAERDHVEELRKKLEDQNDVVIALKERNEQMEKALENITTQMREFISQKTA